mgnify:CR=1 FL=1
MLCCQEGPRLRAIATDCPPPRRGAERPKGAGGGGFSYLNLVLTIRDRLMETLLHRPRASFGSPLSIQSDYMADLL